MPALSAPRRWFSQIVTPRLSVSGAAALTRQAGQLASPYRRALVQEAALALALAGRDGRAGELIGELSYELSLTDYRLYETDLIRAHVPALGLTWLY